MVTNQQNLLNFKFDPKGKLETLKQRYKMHFIYQGTGSFKGKKVFLYYSYKKGKEFIVGIDGDNIAYSITSNKGYKLGNINSNKLKSLIAV